MLLAGACATVYAAGENRIKKGNKTHTKPVYGKEQPGFAPALSMHKKTVKNCEEMKMKKMRELCLLLLLCLCLTACGAENVPAETLPPATEAPAETQAPTGSLTMGESLRAAFETQVAGGETDLQALADALLTEPVIQFAGASMPVEPGYLAGFSAEIHGFQEAVMFGPAIGSIPFVGYVFRVEGDTAAFGSTLLEHADPRWNICVEADQVVTASADDLVFFVMCPEN